MSTISNYYEKFAINVVHVDKDDFTLSDKLTDAEIAAIEKVGKKCYLR